MAVIDFLTADQNGPFMIAAAVVLILGALELVSLMFGVALSGIIQDILPDFDGPDIDGDIGLDTDADADVDGVDLHGDTSVLAQAFSWLNAGRVPLMILLIIFLAGFAVVGYVAQWIAHAVILLPWPLAMIPALMGAVPFTRVASRAFARVMPSDETYVLNEDALVGHIGVVTLGPVTRSKPGKARIVGPHGNTHFIRVCAARPADRFPVGKSVLVTSHERALYDVIEPPDSLSGG